MGLQHLQLVSTKGSMKTVVALEPHVPTHWVMFTLAVDTQSPTFMFVGTTLCAQAAVSLGTGKASENMQIRYLTLVHFIYLISILNMNCADI